MQLMKTQSRSPQPHSFRRRLIIVTILALLLATLKVPAQSVLGRGAEAAVEAATRVSGRAIEPAARRIVIESLEHVALSVGDDALRAARNGGLELCEAAAVHGDEIWRIAAKASPEGARALALRPGELLPLARRIGPEVLELEAKVSGLPVHVSQQFGDDAVRYFAVQVPAKDATRLVGLAQRADSQATRELLLNTYKDKGAAFLQRFDWKVVLATGLSTAMITGTYKVSDGIQDGLKKVADSSPSTFADMMTSPVRWLALPTLLLLLGGVVFPFLHKRGFFGRVVPPGGPSLTGSHNAQPKQTIL